jgi:hypothetical protein
MRLLTMHLHWAMEGTRKFRTIAFCLFGAPPAVPANAARHMVGAPPPHCMGALFGVGKAKKKFERSEHIP